MAKQKPKKSSKPKRKPKKLSLQERIESLTFYGTGDETYELFAATCEFCHRLYGAGSEDWAEKVCEWAEELAAISFRDMSNDSCGYVQPDDTAKGHWGH